MVARVAEVLNLGTDAVYRRVRADTILTAEEMLLLAGKYNLDLNRLSGRKPRPQYEPVIPSYLNSEVEYFEHLNRQQGYVGMLTNVSFRHVSSELPFSYEMAFPCLRTFKIFMYGITTWQLKKWESKKFDPALIDPKAHELAAVFVRTSFDFNGTELLSASIIDITLRQITYMAEVARFKDPNCITNILQELLVLIDHMENMANTGLRFLPDDDISKGRPSYQMYLNELSNSTNLLLLDSDQMDLQTSMTICPNYITTDDKEVFKRSSEWYENLIKNGTLLGSSAPRYTISFFNQLRQKVKATQDYLSRSKKSVTNFEPQW